MTSPTMAPGSTSERAVDRAASAMCWRILSENSTARMCASEIINRLMSGQGIVAERGNERLTTTPRFQRYIDHLFKPFLIDAFRNILTVGLVPIVYRRNALGETYPAVPRPGTYCITTYAYQGEQHFKFYWDTTELECGPGGSFPTTYVYRTGRQIVMTNERLFGGRGAQPLFGRHDPSVVVVSGFGYDPHLDGRLNSIMASVIPHILLANELTDQAVTAERIACCPPIVTAYNPSLENQNARAHTQQFFAGHGSANTGDAPSDTRAYESFERNAEQQEVFRQHVVTFAKTYGEDAAREHYGAGYVDSLSSGQMAIESPAPAWAKNAVGFTMPWLNQYYLGTERQLATLPMPRPRTDYVNLTKQLDENVCAAMGVPRSLFIAASNVRSGVESVTDTMQGTVRLWHSQLGNLATLVYYQLFGQEDLKAELETRMRKKRRGTQLSGGRRVPFMADMLTEDDLFTVEKMTEIRITFDVHPCSSPQDLVTAWSLGMLDDKTFGQTFLRCIGMKERDLKSNTLPMNKEERKMLASGQKPTQNLSGQKRPREGGFSAPSRAGKKTS